MICCIRSTWSDPAGPPTRYEPETEMTDPRCLPVDDIEALLAQAWESRTLDPREAERLARQALAILEKRLYQARPTPRDHDLRARAWIYVANSQRIRNELALAEEALAKAEEILCQGTHSPLLRAELLLIEASVLRDRRELVKAKEKLDQVVAIHRWHGDPHRLGLTLLSKANLLYTAGSPEESVRCLEEAAQLLDFEKDPWARYSLLQCRSLYLNEIGRTAEAKAILPEVREVAAQVGSWLDILRVRWLEGLVAAAEGASGEAISKLQHVHAECLEKGIAYDAALVSLDLAVLYLAENRTAETKVLAEEMLTIFQSLDVSREAFAALILFHRAALQEQATVELVRDISTYLKRSGGRPALKYEQPS